MKKGNYHILKRLVYYAAVMLLFASCQDATITTSAPSDITASTASAGGEVEGNSRARIYEKGVCYSTTPNPTKFDKHIEGSNKPRPFTFVLTGLSGNTTFYVRAYVTYSTENDLNIRTKYGKEFSFKTLNATLPSISTTNAYEQFYGGIILSDGGSQIAEQGICYNKTPNPTISDNKLMEESRKPVKKFELKPELAKGSIYYIRAYAINAAGTAYGNEVVAGVPGFVCSGNAWKDAASYDPSKNGIHPILCDFGNSFPKDWAASAPVLSELIVCRKRSTVLYKTCTYIPNNEIRSRYDISRIEIRRYYEEETYTIREAKTGKILAKRTFRGSEDDCEPVISYTYLPPTTHTNNVNAEEVHDWIKSFVVK